MDFARHDIVRAISFVFFIEKFGVVLRFSLIRKGTLTLFFVGAHNGVRLHHPYLRRILHLSEVLVQEWAYFLGFLDDGLGVDFVRPKHAVECMRLADTFDGFTAARLLL